jgi:signal transduction histidine kinase
MDVYRVWAWRMWPLAALLLALLGADLETSRGFLVPGRWWILPGVFLIGGFALLAPRWPVRAALGCAAVLVVWSVALRVVGAEVVPTLGPLLATEVAAVLAVVVVVVRRCAAGAAAGLVGIVLGACVAAQPLRVRFQSSPTATGPNLLWDVLAPATLLLTLSVAAGLYLRARDRELDRAMRAAVAAAQQRERVSLARELHDVVAHHVGVMVVQAQAARAVAGMDPGAAARALPMIEGSGTDALTAMRRLVTVLREPDGDATPMRTTDLAADLRALIAPPAGGTAPVRLAVDLAEPVPAEVATSVLRLVQESVTNARRHGAVSKEITVSVTTVSGSARIRVHNDGGAAPSRPSGSGARPSGSGYGLVGMRERVQLLGGRFSAGPVGGGGWQVAAEVPLRESGR